MAGSLAALSVALLAAGVMGYAVQRGATCMVAALEEIVAERRARRIVALLEAAAIVAAGMVAAQLAGFLPMPPADHLLTLHTVAGGALLGLGAYVAGSCVFGSIAKLGSGQWAYALVPPGFFLGCLTTGLVPTSARSEPMATSALLDQAALVAVPLLLLVGWRSRRVVRAARGGMLAEHVWSPHVATGVIGLAFVVLLLAVGPWAYTDLLADLARGRMAELALRLPLFLGLFGGAILGGWTAGRLKPAWPTARKALSCLSGGALMGMGSLLIPGSNDGLILLGFPLLRPYAWVALASMAGTILAAMLVARTVRRLAVFPELAY
ncbi:YeeE/YedE family protein [Sphingomonas ginkgonis]|uniref:YeeE/YedE family protein n=1 Tax=Sphingomonas ginkgonis TaxID=2315330 RepID=A0A3R9X8H4_9SPHN|nr:YeeE/YedE thiosulfate transporter family protein [Sphingomonas ginkgonis]RST31265.1 YeeE/YedE family protein [Sphingomonas ginkgonis]